MAGAALPAFVAEAGEPVLSIVLDQESPEKSFGRWRGMESFLVGLGRDGFLPAGSSFKGGSSLLGDFEVNAILSHERFEMEESLIKSSGKSAEWLAESLFSNMSSIDFDGDGHGGEYGDAFIGLKPLHSAAEQPFHFGEYAGVFRWYSYAIHGTQDESRIGKCVTGGCINVGKEDLLELLQQLKLGDFVRITSEIP